MTSSVPGAVPQKHQDPPAKDRQGAKPRPAPAREPIYTAQEREEALRKTSPGLGGNVSVEA